MSLVKYLALKMQGMTDLCLFYSVRVLGAVKAGGHVEKLYSTYVRCANENCNSPLHLSLIQCDCLETPISGFKPYYAPIVLTFAIILAAYTPWHALGFWLSIASRLPYQSTLQLSCHPSQPHKKSLVPYHTTEAVGLCESFDPWKANVIQ